MPMAQSGNADEMLRLIIAVALSVGVIAIGYVVQAALAPPRAARSAPLPAIPATSGDRRAAESDPPVSLLSKSAETTIAEKRYTIETDRIEAVLSTHGGSLVSLKLKGQRDGTGLVDLVVPSGDPTGGLRTAYGEGGRAGVTDPMEVRIVDDRTIEFYGDYLVAGAGSSAPQLCRIRKVYTFNDGEYLFRLALSLEDVPGHPARAGGTKVGYTLSLGPQIGPILGDLAAGASSDYRRFVTFEDGKKKTRKLDEGKPLQLKDRVDWAALVGKYFVLIAVPDPHYGTVTLRSNADPAIRHTDHLSFSGMLSNPEDPTQVYSFYFGPKTKVELSRFDDRGGNAFGLQGLSLESVMDQSSVLGWLESLLKACLNLFHDIVPNYGVDIILVTVLVKAALFPLSKRAAESSARMQALQPQMRELQDKYKNNPQKLNQELAGLYRKEGYNPLSAFLPLLLQIPVFIAMYNIFNTNFDLRGAPFIPGWISDLSQPDSIVALPVIDLLVWKVEALRGLPIIYFASQILYGKYVQSSSPGQDPAQARLMLYGMPAVFFFVLYDVPSGLIVYWIASNLLSLLQQTVIGRHIVQKNSSSRVRSARSYRRGKPS